MTILTTTCIIFLNTVIASIFLLIVIVRFIGTTLHEQPGEAPSVEFLEGLGFRV